MVNEAASHYGVLEPSLDVASLVSVAHEVPTVSGAPPLPSQPRTVSAATGTDGQVLVRAELVGKVTDVAGRCSVPVAPRVRSRRHRGRSLRRPPSGPSTHTVRVLAAQR